MRPIEWLDPREQTIIANLGDRIMRRRVELNISMESLADAVGCSQKAIENWEYGRRVMQVTNLGRIARALNMSVEHLLLGPEEQWPVPQNPPRRNRGAEPVRSRTMRRSSAQRAKESSPSTTATSGH